MGVAIEPQARAFLQISEDASDESLYYANDLAKELINGCRGALKRGVIGPYAMSNVRCRVVNVESKIGLKGIQEHPTSLRAASSHIVSSLLSANKELCNVLEPTMSIEIASPPSMVGSVLSDFNTRRGCVEDVCIGDCYSSAMIQGNVPLKEILGYATSLRSITGGEGSFTAEYVGHSNCSSFNT